MRGGGTGDDAGAPVEPTALPSSPEPLRLAKPLRLAHISSDAIQVFPTQECFPTRFLYGGFTHRFTN